VKKAMERLSTKELIVKKNSQESFESISDRIEKVACITYPRSGHHLMVNALLRYFSNNLQYPEIKDSTRCTNVLQAGKLYYCEHYDHCRQNPCTDDRVNLQKNHDFNLDLICKINKQIIQIRNPIESIVSYYKYHYGTEIREKANWMVFAHEKAEYWKKFVNKWIIYNRNEKVLTLNYSDLIESPATILRKVILFLDPACDVNTNRLKNVIKSLSVLPRNSLSIFCYHDESFFREIELSLSKEMDALKIEPIWSTYKTIKSSSLAPKKYVIGTSLSPNNEKIQKAAIDSWRGNGFEIISFNSAEEASKIELLYPDVQIRITDRNAAKLFGKPYIFLDDILSDFKKLNPDICGIINSDIVMAPNSHLKKILDKELSCNSLVYGSRVEVENLNELRGEFYNNGFDIFFFKPELIHEIPKSLSSIGVTWWDYWFPLVAALNGAKLKKLNRPFGFHASHPTRWSNEQWNFMGAHIAKSIYDMRCEAGSNLPQLGKLYNFDVMVRSAAYLDVSTKNLDISEKINLSYNNLEAFSRCVLCFLKNESINIFKDSNCINMRAKNLIEQSNIKAIKALYNNDLNLALKHLSYALSIEPNDANTLCNCGALALKRGDVYGSIMYYKLCLEKNPYHPTATYNCGKILIQIGKQELAKRLLSVHAHQCPDDIMIGKYLLEMEELTQ
jgi:tetratricopeptide (TPR) repeat protein